MKNKSKYLVVLLIGFLLLLIVPLSGCEKSNPEQTAEDSHQHMTATQAEHTDQVMDTSDQQTLCPVMEGQINKELFTEYEGKKVYFCCPGCKGQFEKEPEKYLDKLPQFKS